MISYIVSDFDGTLIGKDRQVSPAVAAAIKKYLSQGGTFSIATGRAYEGLVQETVTKYSLSRYHIVRGGSEIIDTSDDQVVWGKYLELNQARQIIRFLEKISEVILLAESGKNLYTIDGQSDPEFATGANVLDIKTIPLDAIPKIAIPPLFSLERIQPLVKKIQTTFPDVHVVKTTSHKGVGLDINHKHAGKHQALLAYANINHVSVENIMGIGDSYNDIPLLEACGYKVAMGNAPDELKRLADLIAPDQDDDGLFIAIYKALS